MQSITALVAALALLAPATAHMSLSYPAPFRAAVNPNVPESAIDFTPTAPLSGAAQFPCKGYQSDIGTPQGKAVADWNAGTQYNFTVLGSAVHGGGSCEAALSYDKGVTWKVIHTYLGSCPLKDGQSFDFTIPSDAPATGTDGTIFAWLWYNVIGNREIYMSCASVTVNAGSKTRSAPAVAYSSRPDLFVANLDNGCTTVEGKEVQIPIPGPAADVTTDYSIADNSGSFTGTCKAVAGIGGESGSSSSPPSSSAAPAASGSPAASPIASSVASTSEQSATLSTPSTSVYTVPGFEPSSASSSGVFATSAASSSPAESSAPSISSSPVESSAPSSASTAPVSSGTSTGSSGLTVSDNGSCGPGIAICEPSMCCSSYGFCGSSDSYCGSGCQEGFGQCGTFLNSTSSTGSAAPTGAKFRIRM
ncbi:Endochitinase A [Hyphodiscus hymeniophilus]|uniref:Endochitinase A n=1 Tax=Hyphodiscus hymeniophilus TaxID=353542 RepID=A0A9P6SLV9_9HELO|nr:Endochitinase A [Hyphodiscus hymeniophilus]